MVAFMFPSLKSLSRPKRREGRGGIGKAQQYKCNVATVFLTNTRNHYKWTDTHIRFGYCLATNNDQNLLIPRLSIKVYEHRQLG